MLVIIEGRREFFCDQRLCPRRRGDALRLQANAVEEEIELLTEDAQGGRGADGGVQARPQLFPQLWTDVDGHAADGDRRFCCPWLEPAQLDDAHVAAGVVERPEPAIVLAHFAQVAQQGASQPVAAPYPAGRSPLLLLLPFGLFCC